MAAANDYEWWRGAVIYQIYPRSFCDTNGDGIGDLNGISEKLEHVASLGVDGIWISPFYKSPMKDFGYDVSDYREVDPMFGTLEDFDRLLETAHDLGLKVIIDQVYSHTSDQHAWFEESRQGRKNRRSDWYVWADAKIEGSPPNNWQSTFACPAWTWDARRQQYYLHNFLPSQPDLNLHSREVQDALLDVGRFWLDRGVDGFRLDAINCGMHDPHLRDNPPAPPECRSETRPAFMQMPKYNMSHGAMPEVLERIRKVADSYGSIFTVAEVGTPNPLATMKDYTTGNKRLNSAYGFEFLGTQDLTPERVREILGGWPGEDGEGWPAWAFSNHDAPRPVSRWCDGAHLPQRAKLIGMLLLSLRGNIFVYQGEELGLPQGTVPFERLRDPEAFTNWPHTLGRDGARTPMPWEHKHKFGGFSSVEPWLPSQTTHRELAVDLQDTVDESVLNFFRQTIRMRSSSPALRYGTMGFLDAPDGVLAFTRSAEEEVAWCVFNLGDEAVEWRAPCTLPIEIRSAVGIDLTEAGVPLALDGYCGYIGFEQ